MIKKKKLENALNKENKFFLDVNHFVNMISLRAIMDLKLITFRKLGSLCKKMITSKSTKDREPLIHELRSMYVDLGKKHGFSGKVFSRDKEK